MDAAPLEPQQGRSSAFARVNGAASATADTAVFINFVKNVTAAHDVEPLPPGMLPVGHRTSAHSTPVTSAANTPISGSPLVGPLPSPRVPALHYPVPVPVQYGYGAFALPPPAAADPASVAVKQERPRAMYVTDGSYYFPASAPFPPTAQMIGQLYHATQAVTGGSAPSGSAGAGVGGVVGGSGSNGNNMSGGAGVDGRAAAGSPTPRARGGKAGKAAAAAAAATPALTGDAMTDYAVLASTLGAEAASRIRQLKRYRESHNEVERRRRENINQVIGELAKLVPDCYPGQSKGSVLRKTADFLQFLEQQGVLADQRTAHRAAQAARSHSGSRTGSNEDDDDEEDDEDADDVPAREHNAERGNAGRRTPARSEPTTPLSAGPATKAAARTHSDAGKRKAAADVVGTPAKRGRPPLNHGAADGSTGAVPTYVSTANANANAAAAAAGGGVSPMLVPSSSRPPSTPPSPNGPGPTQSRPEVVIM